LQRDPGVKEIKKILVVDDNPEIRDSLEELLSQHGCPVVTAEDGYAAIEKANKSKFDVILLDVKMPGIDGIETAVRIKKEKTDALIILMTAFSIEELAEKALGAGVDGVIIKPFDVHELLTFLSKKKDAALYFSMLEKLWKHMERSLGLKSCRTIFEGVIKKSISRENVVTFLERTGDGIFVNRIGENGGSDETELDSKFSKLLAKYFEKSE
jgi:CheY-like chemotaxis protein